MQPDYRAIKMDIKTIKDEIETTKISQKDLPQLASLIGGMRNISSGSANIRSTSAAYYNWMYFQNPAGPAYAYKSVHNGTIVSSFAMAPKRFLIDGKETLIGKTMDMFTHPSYQGMGLIKEPMAKVFDSAKANGIRSWYTTPSDMSYPIFVNKLQYIEPFELNFLVSPVRIGSILTYKLPKLPLKRIFSDLIDLPNLAYNKWKRTSYDAYTIIKKRPFENEVDDLWDRSPKNRILQIRDATYLNWRYVMCPDSYTLFHFYKSSKLIGLLILKITKRSSISFGEIIDFVFEKSNSKVFNAMISFATEYFKNMNCTVMQTWAIKNSRIEKLFKHSRLFFRRKKVYFLLSPDFFSKTDTVEKRWTLLQGDGNDI